MMKLAKVVTWLLALGAALWVALWLVAGFMYAACVAYDFVPRVW